MSTKQPYGHLGINLFGLATLGLLLQGPTIDGSKGNLPAIGVGFGLRL